MISFVKPIRLSNFWTRLMSLTNSDFLPAETTETKGQGTKEKIMPVVVHEGGTCVSCVKDVRKWDA